ncbi:MAG: FAD-binding oxidoreductase [Candidatus Poribacteria bacterium]
MQDANFSQIDGVIPQEIVEPSSVSEVQSMLDQAVKKKLSVIPAGNGSKLSIGNPPTQIDLLMTMRKFDKVVEYIPDDLTITVGSGMLLKDVQKILADNNQLLPTNPPYENDATIGGVVATNSSGPHRLRYGTTRDLVLGLRVVQASGTIIKAGGKVVKNVAGYDINKLYIASYGTLGIITEASFKLFPKPEIERTMLLTFSQHSKAIRVATEILKSQLLPVFVNFFSTGIPTTEVLDPCLLVGIDGHPETVSWQIDQINSIADLNGAVKIEVYKDQKQSELRSRLCAFPEGKWSDPVVICRINIRPSDVSDFISSVLDIVDPFSVHAMSHIGNGTVYLILSDFVEEQFDLLATILTILRNQVANIQGNLILETAPLGLKNLIDVWGEAGKKSQLMTQIKSKLDPTNILNPGRFVSGI